MKKKILSLITALAVIVTSIVPGMEMSASAQETSQSAGQTYYVSTLHGKDSNRGTSETTPFYSLQKINELDLQPGDQILLEAGSRFVNGYLHLFEKSGTAESPIVVDRYGEGNAPVISTNGQGIWYQNYGKQLDSSGHRYTGYVSSSVLLYDTEYVEINNLEIENRAPRIENTYNAIDVMNRTGVAAVSQNRGTLDHIYLNNLYVHDVIGNVYDKHMNNGGIYFTVFKPENESTTGISRYEDVKIENCTVENVNRWGIAVGYTAYWDQFTGTAISDQSIAKYGSGDVVIRNNYVKEAGGDAITTMYCDRPLIEYNVSDGAARQINTTDYSQTGSGRVAAAIWPWKCKDAIFQYNECFDTYLNQDGQAWDADSGDGTVYQYNYSHNNGGGCVMFCAGQSYQNIFRYNISQNDLSGVINAPSQPDAHIYNNVFFVKDKVPFIRPGMTGGTMVVENNIIYYAGSSPRTEDWTLGGTRASYSNNLYYNYTNTPADDKKAVKVGAGTKVFLDPGKAPSVTDGTVNKHEDSSNVTVFDGYKLAENSPAINAGKTIAANGGKDFYGNTITGTTDIGVHETDGASLSISSVVYQISGTQISGVSKNTTVETLLKNLTYNASYTITVLDQDNKELTGTDIVKSGYSVVISDGKDSLRYTIMADNDSSIRESLFDMKDHTMFVPITAENPITVSKIKEGLKIADTSELKFYSNSTEVISGPAKEGMVIKVIAENGSSTEYTIAAKTEYDWASDFVEDKQGNTWFAQQKKSGSYENMKSFSSQWLVWEGESYAAVGLEGDRGQIVAGKKGLLVDSITSSAGNEGHSMAFRASMGGKVRLSFGDMGDKKNAYLRQATASAPNSGSNVYLTVTLNGNPVGDARMIPNDGSGLEIPALELDVKQGEFIRLEIKNDGNSATKGSAYVTPHIEYLSGILEEFDKSELDKKLAEAGQLNNQTHMYTTLSFQKLKEAITKADTVKQDKQATEKEIADAVTALEQAMKALEKVTVSLNQNAVSLTAGAAVNLNALTNETGAAVKWSSSAPNIASVDQNGKVTALISGMAVITGEVYSAKASCTITVKENPVKIVLDKTNVTLYTRPATSAALRARVTGSTEAVNWVSSDTRIAVVKNGKVTAVKKGTVLITARIGNASASCRVTVLNPELRLPSTKITLYTKGLTSTTVKPEIIGPVSKVIWMSRNPKVAVVKNGKITALKQGTVQIRVTANGVTKNLTVRVLQPDIKMDKTSVTLYTKGQTEIQLKPVIVGASKKTVWSSSNKKTASVKDGKVTAKGKGTAIITVKANGVTKQCKVTVKKASLTLEKSRVTLKKGKTLKLVSKAVPNGKKSYKSDDVKVASVNKRGVIKAVGKGKTTIRVTCSGMTKSVKVTVR